MCGRVELKLTLANNLENRYLSVTFLAICYQMFRHGKFLGAVSHMKQGIQERPYAAGAARPPRVMVLPLRVTLSHWDMLYFAGLVVPSRILYSLEVSCDGITADQPCFSRHFSTLRLTVRDNRTGCAKTHVSRVFHWSYLILDGSAKTRLVWSCQGSITLYQGFHNASFARMGRFQFNTVRLYFAKEELRHSLAREFAEGQYGSRHHMTECVQEQIGLVAAIEAKRHFFAVGLKVFRADSMPRTDNSALQERECGLNGIGIDIALGINVEFVSDSFVSAILPKMFCCAPIGQRIIGEKNFHVFTDVLADVLFKGSRLCILRVEKPKIAAPLTNADNRFLVGEAGGLSLSPVLAADIGFVHFDFAIQHRFACFDHCCPDAMAEIPRRLIASESKGALNLASGHALLCFAEKQCSDEPLRKRQVRVIKDRASGDCELIVAIFAVVESLFGCQFHDGHLAARALNAFGPAQLSQNLAALFIGWEHPIYVN
jgi:hypothetical protein